MFTNFMFPWISLSQLLLVIFSIVTWHIITADKARKAAIVGLGLNLLFLSAAFGEITLARGQTLTEPWPVAGVRSLFVMDSLNALPMMVLSALALGMVILVPRRKLTPRWLAGVLLLTTATLTAYAANTLMLLVLAWGLAVLPFLVGRFFSQLNESQLPALSKLAMIGSVVSLAIGVGMIISCKPELAFQPWIEPSNSLTGITPFLRYAFVFLVVAVVLRQGLVPVHSWVVTAYERGPLLPLTLFVNSHLGALLLVRLVNPLLPDIAREALPILGYLGLFTAAYTAILALAEPKPRRLLALLTVSQTSFVLLGLQSNTLDGIVGSFIHWQVVAVATTVLAAVYVGIEARLGSAIEGKNFLGLATTAPRLAVFFVVAGLALVGLPLTLGFCAEDLLLHATLATHPQLGLVMPMVTALNAFSVLRLFARLFLGRPMVDGELLVDALPRERLVLTCCLLFLILGGLFPSVLLQLPSTSARRLSTPATSVLETTSIATPASQPGGK